MAVEKKGAPRRVTIMIPVGLDTRIRYEQAEWIKRHNETRSYSSALCEILKRGMK